jgi:aminoglycoside 6'-N-acetyltransferase I
MLIITDLPASAHNAAAALLVEGFREIAPTAWPDHASAHEEVASALEPEKICRAAFIADRLIGWIGAQLQYEPYTWELHPLVVDAAYRKQGIGRALVRDLEVQVAARGGQTIMLGSDDEQGMTSLSGIDLYPDPWVHIAQIHNLRGHPYSFYQRCGFTIVGVIPDANGWGKPDILMAKRVQGKPDLADSR